MATGILRLQLWVYYRACGTLPIKAICLSHTANFPLYFCFFLLWASLAQSKTSTKQKTKKPSETWHMMCGNNNSLRREMLAQTKQVG